MHLYQTKSETTQNSEPVGEYDRETVTELIAAWMLTTPSEDTRNARMTALNRLAKFAGYIDAAECIGKCSERGKQWTSWLCLRFREELITGKRPRAASSVNTYMANIQSLFKFAQEMEFVAGPGCKPHLWRLNIKRLTGVQKKRRRDVKALPKNDVAKRMGRLHSYTLREKRDRMVASLFSDVGLRVSEVGRLLFEDWDSEERRLLVRRKGRIDKTSMLVVEPVAEIIDDYTKTLKKIGTPKYLVTSSFKRKDETWGQNQVHRSYLYRLMKTRMGTNPHRLRRHAIQSAVDAAAKVGIPLHDVILFTGHKSVETIREYWDDNDDRYRMIAEKVAAANRAHDELENIDNIEIDEDEFKIEF